MPKKSSGSKSKRVTLRQKYKVIRKVREHHKKKAKELRKKGGKAKAQKDPGIPSAWPFKAELIKELQVRPPGERRGGQPRNPSGVLDGEGGLGVASSSVSVSALATPPGGYEVRLAFPAPLA